MHFKFYSGVTLEGLQVLWTLWTLWKAFQSRTHFADERSAQALLVTPEEDPNLPLRLNNVGLLHRYRYLHLQKPEDIEDGIKCITQALSLTHKDHPLRAAFLFNLGLLHEERFEHLGKLEDIDRAIECSTEGLSATPSGHMKIPMRLHALSVLHQNRFDHFNKTEDLVRAIDYGTQSVSLTPNGHAQMPRLLNVLGELYCSRYLNLADAVSLVRSLECFRESASSSAGDPVHRFLAALNWAEIAKMWTIPEQLSAFQSAMDLVPHMVWLGETISQRYNDVQSIGDIAREGAAVAICAKRYDLALEWLEQGRSIVWNQTLQLRTPFDNLFSVKPSLANTLREIANKLKTAGSRSPNSTTPTNDSDTLEDAAQKHRRLAEQYDQLVNEARRIPGFESFLRPKKASELIGAARTGPVVIINVHAHQGDALVLLPHQTEIKHVPLPQLSEEGVTKVRAELERSLQKHGIRNRGVRRVPAAQEEDGFERALSTLWMDIVKPVLDSLRYTVCVAAANCP
jgi:tetratricopeptide (TPR) repeat protein